MQSQRKLFLESILAALQRRMLISEDVVIPHPNTSTAKNDNFHKKRNIQLLSKINEHFCEIVESRYRETN